MFYLSKEYSRALSLRTPSIRVRYHASPLNHPKWRDSSLKSTQNFVMDNESLKVLALSSSSSSLCHPSHFWSRSSSTWKEILQCRDSSLFAFLLGKLLDRTLAECRLGFL
mmetsp:Transcript_14206/g.25715  ORF Transcript_14206/g.25715 Transcript_14206/m.25715 type:complete len:110 (-) Transcript_14206:2593-2922(-)